MSINTDDSLPPPRSGLIKFRRGHPLLGRPDFLQPQDITWHEDNWENAESKFLAFSLHDRCWEQMPSLLYCIHLTFHIRCELHVRLTGCLQHA